MSEKSLVPELRFPEYAHQWKTKNLTKVSIVNPSNVDLPEEFIYIDLESVEQGRLVKKEKVLSKEAPSRAQRVLKSDDILYQMVRPYQRNNFHFHEKGDYVASTGYAQIRTDESSGYLYQYIHTDNFVNKVLVRCTGTSYPAINSKELGKIRVSLPSLPEQQKIASFLSAVDQRIALLEKKKELLEQYKKGVMQKIFSQEIRFKDEHGNDFPDWEYIKANELFRNHSNKDHNGELPILSASQEHGMIFREDSGIRIQSSESSVKSYKIVEKNDFVISLRSFQGGIDFSSITGICSPAYIVLKNKKPIDYHFYKHFFKKESFIHRLSNTVVGIRDGKQITYDNFSSLKIPYPSMIEQMNISSFIDSIEELRERLEHKLDLSKKFKKGLLQKMFV